MLERRLEKSVATLPLAADARLVTVAADDEEDAWAQVVTARGQGPSELSRVLGRALAESDGSRFDLVIGGRFPQLTRQVLLDALALSAAPRLPGVRIVYVSAEPPDEELSERVASYGAELLHRTLAPLLGGG